MTLPCILPLQNLLPHSFRFVCFLTKASSDDDLVAVVRERVLEPDHDLVLVRGVVYEDAPELDRDVRKCSSVTEGVAATAAPPHRNRSKRSRTAVDHDTRAEPQRDLLGRLDERRRCPGISCDVKGSRGFGIGGNHVERHDAARLKPLHKMDGPQSLGSRSLATPLRRRPDVTFVGGTACDAQSSKREQTHGVCILGEPKGTGVSPVREIIDVPTRLQRHLCRLPAATLGSPS